ncbi:ATP-dependent DNA helicase RecG [Lachnotalea glycerini]|uniref:ATP-dependent DNA helicase RecG n=1 Tax=Lachnotalea glycerini TaxID=1763509 RepID=A0A371JJ60_9FIRM|nr:ATP-dependent DNA helicase RecG [Lachnotalea glycerini]RDY32740.1 ATP-dependent DNA helicase RecG [Lachnotalea glycerini]
MDQDSLIINLKGVGEKTSALFHKIGIDTVEDLISYYPRDYDVYKEPVLISGIKSDETVAVEGIIIKNIEIKKIRSLTIVTTAIKDESGALNITWYNMPFLKNAIKQGSHLILRGRINNKNGRLTMEQPQIFQLEEYKSVLKVMQPKYSLIAGITNHTITKAVKQAMEQNITVVEYLPKYIRKQFHLAEYNFAVENIHFPNNMEDLIIARNRLVFDEFFLFILAIRQLKEKKEAAINHFELFKVSDTQKLIQMLPYRLTNAQLKVWDEIEQDLIGETVMNRLVQGDVGSGKTIIAILGILMVISCGYQGAFMVPTEVLAKQQYNSITELFMLYQFPYKAVLLTGSMTAKEKREVYRQIETGGAQVIVGTHALIQEKVQYKNLALVVTDEQHRFGVRQRETLSKKGQDPHVLVMSATPIPRTLAIILYGDLDVSVIDELPAERQVIKNCVVNSGYRQTAYQFIKKEVESGRQAYIICPMVEESENIEVENVVEYAQLLKTQLPANIRIEYLHGKMKAKDKNNIMEQFGANEIQVLVSTTVVEVGVNVVNATVMMIENAERFGLAQLHQLRGRVGRGKHQSYCILVNGSDSKASKKRLEILNKSNDGFFIASEDLKLRGPGDLFGIRQSGLLEFKIGDVFTDASVLQNASEAATVILDKDRNLEMPENKRLREKIDQYMKLGLSNLSL